MSRVNKSRINKTRATTFAEPEDSDIENEHPATQLSRLNEQVCEENHDYALSVSLSEFDSLKQIEDDVNLVAFKDYVNQRINKMRFNLTQSRFGEQVLEDSETESDEFNSSECETEQSISTRHTRTDSHGELSIQDRLIASTSPSFIEAAIDRNFDFNIASQAALGAENNRRRQRENQEQSEGGDEEPHAISLIEAFDMRVRQVQDMIDANNDDNNDEEPISIPNIPNVRANRNSIRLYPEDNIQPSTIAIDLFEFTHEEPTSDFIKAVQCLNRAQEINEYYKTIKIADEAARTAPPHLAETAAVFAKKSFHADLQENRTVVDGDQFHSSMEIISFIGVTRPNNN